MPLEAVPAAASAVFGPRLSLAEQFALLLAVDGVTRGLIGPREPERLWTRHLLNCAAITELFPPAARVVDVGSGAGLPGLVIAIQRPDLRVDLVEPLQRRVDFLSFAVRELGLGERVQVIRGRAEDLHVISSVGAASWVTARAVAPLDRLAAWCFPLLADAGSLTAIKGSGAAGELAKNRAGLERLGATNAHIVECGLGLIEPALTVVVVESRATSRRKSARTKEADGAIADTCSATGR